MRKMPVKEEYPHEGNPWEELIQAEHGGVPWEEKTMLSVRPRVMFNLLEVSDSPAL